MGCLCGPFRGYGCISAIQVIIDFGFIGSTVNKVLFFVDVVEHLKKIWAVKRLTFDM